MGRITSLYKLTTLGSLQGGILTNLAFTLAFRWGGSASFETLLTVFLVHSISTGLWITLLILLTLLTLPLNGKKKKTNQN